MNAEYTFPNGIKFDFRSRGFGNYLLISNNGSSNTFLRDPLRFFETKATMVALSKGWAASSYDIQPRITDLRISVFSEEALKDMTHELLIAGMQQKGFFTQEDVDKAEVVLGITPTTAVSGAVVSSAPTFKQQNEKWIKDHEQAFRNLGLGDADLSVFRNASSKSAIENLKYDMAHGEGAYRGKANYGLQGRIPLFTDYYAAAEIWEKGAAQAAAAYP